MSDDVSWRCCSLLQLRVAQDRSKLAGLPRCLQPTNCRRSIGIRLESSCCSLAMNRRSSHLWSSWPALWRTGAQILSIEYGARGDEDLLRCCERSATRPRETPCISDSSALGERRRGPRCRLSRAPGGRDCAPSASNFRSPASIARKRTVTPAGAQASPSRCGSS